MHVDFKIEAWERVKIPENQEEAVLEALKTGKVQTSNDLVNFLADKGGADYDGMIPETEEQMCIEENDGQSTIQFYPEHKGSDPSWENGVV